jgi:hypothetical protein
MDDLQQRGFVPVQGIGDAVPDLADAVEAGELTPEQANERMQQAVRRDAAEHGPTLDTDADGTVTSGGFGSGQGMGNQRTGQNPT